MLSFPRKPEPAVLYREKQLEDERIRDVEMLLESLFLREETTLRLILDCLYDVGSMNLVNRRVRSRPLNKLMKAIARWSKPVFRPFMLRWSKKNCPHMIADWLHSQVRFSPGEVLLPEVISPDNQPAVSK